MVFAPLPPEIWLMIYRFVVDVPGLLDTTPQLIPGSDDTRAWNKLNHPDEQKAEIASSMAMKLDLILVCRSWRDMAGELLYESIRIRRTKSLVQLATALRASHQKDAALRTPGVRLTHAGAFTKRLHFCFDALGLDYDVGRDALNHIFRLCVNLQIFIFDLLQPGTLPLDHPLRQIPVLLEQHSHALRFFSWHSFDPTWPSPLLKLQRKDRLEAIRMYLPRLPTQEFGTISLPRLHRLTLNGFATFMLNYPSKLELPALKTIEVVSKEPPPISFFEHHGDGLRSLAVTVFRPFALDICAIISHCPSLQVLTVDPSALMRPLPSHRNLAMIRLVTDPILSSSRLRLVLEDLVPKLSKLKCPSLSRLRVLGLIVGHFKWDRRNDTIVPRTQEYIQMLNDKKIQLEDADGVVLQAPKFTARPRRRKRISAAQEA